MKTPTVRRFEKAAQLGFDAAWNYEPRLVAAYSALLKQAADQAADALPQLALAAAGQKAGGAPRWSKPHEEELGNQLRAVYETNKKTGPIRVEAMRAATGPPLAVIGLNFSLTNPFVKDVLLQAGKSIDVVETTRRDLMQILNASWEKGDSIPHAAEALRAYGLDNTRATLIARTELIAIANGGSHAAALTSAQTSDAQPAFDGLPPLLKIWLTAEDDLVRDTHIEAGATYSDGSGIPLDQPFYVGDSELQYPGDPDGSAEEICNCRCAISYEEAPVVASGRARRLGAVMKHPRSTTAAADQSTVDQAREEAAGATTADVEDAIPLGETLADAREFVCCLCMEGMETSDHRFIALDAIAWRPLPLTITAQLRTSDGHNDAVVAGRIDTIEKMPAAAALAAGLIPEDRDYPADAVAVIGRGPFANTWEGDEVMQLVADRMLRGVSVELAVLEGELIELPPEGDSPYGDLLDVTVEAEIASACIVAFPAFAEAQIMLASQADDGGLAALDAEAAAEEAGEGESVAASAASGWRFRVIVAAPLQMTRAAQLATRAGRHAYASVDYSGGSMIAVHPTPDQAAACTQPGGQGSNEMHVTLAHLPNPDGMDFAALNKLVAGVAADAPAVSGHVGGAGYFAATEQKGIPAAAGTGSADTTPAAGATGGTGSAEPAQAVAAAGAPPAPAAPETDSGANEPAPSDAADPEAATLHPHVALVDAPGLSKLRANLCQAMDDVGIDYSQNHDFTPHMTLGYEPEAGVPAVHLAGQPLDFNHITVHEGLNRTAHPMQGGEALTASAAGAAPVKPPSAWFDDPMLDEPTGFTVTSDGQVYGHIATWGTCHTGLQDACVRPPRNQSGYRMFHLGEVETADGDFIPVGTLTLDSGHADLKLNARAAKRHYDDTGVAACDCVVGEDAHGIWIAGAVRPDLSMSQVRKLRGSKPSGDWRTVGGAFEMIGIAAVNTPGFPVPRPKARVLAASGADGQRVTALVAAGIDLASSDASETRPAELYRLLDRAIPGSSAERQAALVASALG